jgi:hypothetical protein
MSKVKNVKNVELLHQKEELDILESIYMEEIDIHNAIPPYKFSVQCRPYLDYSLDEALERFAVKLEIELGPNYPQEAPRCEIKHHVDKITHYEVQSVNKMVEKTAQEMKGTPMLFEIVESIRNWLQNSIVDPELRPKKQKRKNPDDEFGMDDGFEDNVVVVNLTKKDTYTPVTRESFLEWKAKFDLDMETIARLRGDISGVVKEERASGKQLFERDMKLIMSDALYQDENDVEDVDDYVKEEEKEDEDEENDEKTKALFCYDEELFEGDVDDIE